MAGWFHEPSQEFPPWFWELTSAEDAALSAEEAPEGTLQGEVQARSTD